MRNSLINSFCDVSSALTEFVTFSDVEHIIQLQSILYIILISRIFCRFISRSARLSAIIAPRFLLKYIILSVYVAILLILLSSSVRFVVCRDFRIYEKKLIAHIEQIFFFQLV